MNRGVRVKGLCQMKRRNGGRNFLGKITAFHLGGGHRNYYRIVDWVRYLWYIPARIRRVEYDPNRKAFLALICYSNGVLSYILAWEGLQIESLVCSGEFLYRFGLGWRTSLRWIQLGIKFHGIEYTPSSGAKLVRAAGTFGQIRKKKRMFCCCSIELG